MLFDQGVEPVAVCIGCAHFHVLARFPDKRVRPRLGRAKKHACYVLKDNGFTGRLWGAGAKVTPIRDRKHQVSVFNYVCRHQAEGAWVWTFRQGVDWPTTIHRR